MARQQERVAGWEAAVSEEEAELASRRSQLEVGLLLVTHPCMLHKWQRRCKLWQMRPLAPFAVGHLALAVVFLKFIQALNLHCFLQDGCWVIGLHNNSLSVALHAKRWCLCGATAQCGAHVAQGSQSGRLEAVHISILSG